jgi:hypothetical protein
MRPRCAASPSRAALEHGPSKTAPRNGPLETAPRTGPLKRPLSPARFTRAAQVHTALKLSQDDQATISTLRKEIEKAWKMVDAAQQKETRAKDTIAQLTDEISNLSKLVEKGAKLSGGQESFGRVVFRAAGQAPSNCKSRAKSRANGEAIPVGPWSRSLWRRGTSCSGSRMSKLR